MDDKIALTSNEGERPRMKKDWRFWTIFAALMLIAFLAGALLAFPSPSWAYADVWNL